MKLDKMLSIAALVLSVASVPASAQVAPAVGLIGIGVNATNLERSIKFYVQGLGMKELSRVDAGANWNVFLGYPAMPYPPMFELIAPKVSAAAAGKPAPVTTTFKVVLSVDDAVALAAQVKAAGFEPGQVRHNASAGSASFFAKDPDGYTIEVVQRPATPPKQ